MIATHTVCCSQRRLSFDTSALLESPICLPAPSEEREKEGGVRASRIASSLLSLSVRNTLLTAKLTEYSIEASVAIVVRL